MRLPICLTLLVFTISATGFSVCVRADDLKLTIVTLAEQKKNWRLFGEAKTPMKVEGRMKDRSQLSVEFENCELPFLADSGIMLPLISRKQQNVTVTGHFDLGAAAPLFRVTRLEASASDEELAKELLTNVDRRDPNAWMVAGNKIARRARFYKDDEVMPLAYDAWVRAFEIDRRNETRLTAKKLDKWVTEMKELGIPDEPTRPFRHQALRLEWAELKTQRILTENQFDRFTASILNQLPGAAKPLEIPHPKLAAEYAESPQLTYEGADPDTRRTLERLFYRDVVLAVVLRGAADDGKNGDEIAEKISLRLSDVPETVQVYRQKHLEYRRKNIARASREEALNLSRELRLKGLTEEADKTVGEWLQLHLDEWRRDGADGLIYAASEFVKLREDKKTAIQLLFDAWKSSPGNPRVAEEIEKFGFRLHDGKWITEKEFTNLPPDPMAQAAGKGEVLKGMVPALVLKALGNPDQKLISMTRRYTSEVWVYGGGETGRLSIHFLRANFQAADDARVIAIGNRAIAKPKAEPAP